MSNEEKILAMLVDLKESTDKQFESMDKRFEGIDKRLESMDKRFEAVDKRLESMDKRFDAIDKRLDTMDERMDRLDEHMDRLDERSQRTAVLLETEVDRKLNLLYEGHETIMECLDKLAPKDRVDELESDVIVLKTAVKMLTQEIAELKKAQ
mgnify:CR=1 FL=1